MTAQALCARIAQRFPGSGLSKVSAELTLITSEAKERAAWLARPNRGLRAGSIFLGVLLAAMPVVTVYYYGLPKIGTASSLADFAQGIDAGVQEVILLAGAIYFLGTFERRLKRTRALKALHELRSLAHIIDMHQLLKDPKIFAGEWQPTSASPERTEFTPFFLSVTSIIAAKCSPW